MAKEVRLRFFTDLHGSTLCWRKAMGAAHDERLKPDVIIIGGDITAKSVVPILRIDECTCAFRFEGVARQCDIDQLPHVQAELEDRGAYSRVFSTGDAFDYFADGTKQQQLARELQLERLDKWLRLVAKYLKSTGIKVIVNCGNDDPFWIDEVLEKEQTVLFAEGRAITLSDGLALVSVGYSPPTPFRTLREEPEFPDLHNRIEYAIGLVPSGYRMVFSFHCPPKNTALDAAPALDADLRPIPGATVSAGSVAVRRAIEEHAPILGLHGHVHERYARDTVAGVPCFNPGSQYWTGTLPGVFAVVRNGRLVLAELTSDTLPPGRSSGIPISAMVKTVAGTKVGRAWDAVLQSTKNGEAT